MRVEQEGRKERIAMMRTVKMTEERERRQESKLSVVRKLFPDTNLTPGWTWKLPGEKQTDTHTHRLVNLKCFLALRRKL